MRRTCLAVALVAAALAFPGSMTATRADVMATCNGLPVTITGTGDDDVIIGTPGDDVIFAGAGNDTVYGLSGNDTICGGPGDDTVFGGPGNDIVLGDAGDDIFIADPVVDGSDVFYGGTGVDIVSYEARCNNQVSVYLDGKADSGAPDERDTVGNDVESYLLPSDVPNNPGGELSCGSEPPWNSFTRVPERADSVGARVGR